ncbi:Solute carrier family 23 member 2 [Holothuria leucospilota]|uniref:Solute carrier family 23 member 2 n=1 Tax=Holothuria leucospilota TaxID=206669 RepID=A0A9Q1HF72_HOLLE|nr:Solute carrier family 23 member 2 [Holothuria leucospilota]
MDKTHKVILMGTFSSYFRYDLWTDVSVFNIIMAAVIGWFFAFFLTIGGGLPNDPQSPTYFARTDFGNQFISDAPWFTLPTPVAKRWPFISITATFGMLAGILASIVESMGDYNACASLSHVPPPPHHAVNRGILIEGLGCVLSGLWGTGTGTGTYSGNIVAIGMTRVASRRVTQGTAVLVILAGLFGKLIAVLASIPDPVIGGVLGALTGMVLSVAITIIQKADMASSRNLFIVGFAFFTGISVPAFLRANPDAIRTGLPRLDEVLQILLTTGMFVGGFVGLVLDNTVPNSFRVVFVIRLDFVRFFVFALSVSKHGRNISPLSVTTFKKMCGQVVSTSDLQPEGLGFDSWPGQTLKNGTYCHCAWCSA